MSEGKGQRVELGRKTKKYCQEFNEFLLNTSRISITYRPRWWELERSSRERNTHGAGPQYKNVGPVGGEEERSRNRQWSTRGAIDTGVRFIPSAGHFQDCAYSIEYGSLSRQLFQAPCFGSCGRTLSVIGTLDTHNVMPILKDGRCNSPVLKTPDDCDGARQMVLEVDPSTTLWGAFVQQEH